MKKFMLYFQWDWDLFVLIPTIIIDTHEGFDIGLHWGNFFTGIYYGTVAEKPAN